MIGASVFGLTLCHNCFTLPACRHKDQEKELSAVRVQLENEKMGAIELRARLAAGNKKDIEKNPHTGDRTINGVKTKQEPTFRGWKGAWLGRKENVTEEPSNEIEASPQQQEALIMEKSPIKHKAEIRPSAVSRVQVVDMAQMTKWRDLEVRVQTLMAEIGEAEKKREERTSKTVIDKVNELEEHQRVVLREWERQKKLLKKQLVEARVGEFKPLAAAEAEVQTKERPEQHQHNVKRPPGVTPAP